MTKIGLNEQMNKTMMTICFLLFALHGLACTDEGTPPPGYQRTISLTAEDVGTTDAWLRVRFSDAPPYSFHLMRDSHTVASVSTAPADTLIGDETLLPSRIYTYRAYRLWGAAVSDSSEAVTVRTMDTTSSAWHWALDTLGDMNSYLVDCAIINDTLIYAVGQIFHADSSEPWTFFNLAKWNGRQWTLHRVYYQGNIQHLRWILAFNENDIWVNPILRWNGVQWQQMPFDPIFSGVTTNKAWGTSSSDFYVVGNGGFIAHYNGTRWRRVESGTTLALSDVFGVSASEVYATGNDRAFARGVVLRGNGQTLQTMIVSEGDTTGLFQTRLYGGIEALWVDERGTLYTVGGLMYQYKHGRWDYVRSLPGNCVYCNPGAIHRGYLYGMAGNASNDMLVVGEVNTLRHFNGLRWSEVGLPYYPLKTNIIWYSADLKDNVAVVVGEVTISFGRGLVMRLWK